MPDTWVEGETATRVYTLLNNGVAHDLTGATVTLEARDKNGTDVAIAGTVAIASAAAGTVTYSPHSSDLTVARSPLRVHFKVTLAGKDAYFPAEPDSWRVYAV